MSIWNPWRGCHRISEGCLYCYIHKGDKKKGIDTNIVCKTKDFYKPIEKKKNGEYKIQSGLCYLCFQSDFLLPDCDSLREECFKMIKERPDVMFLFLTKRIDRLKDVLPDDWENGYDNLIVTCTVENQREADYRLPIFNSLKIKHKNIAVQPMLEKMDIEKYLTDIDLVVCGGESDSMARPLDYSWVLDLREQCIRTNTSFDFRQFGSYSIIDGEMNNYRVFELTKKAKEKKIDWSRNDGL